MCNDYKELFNFLGSWFPDIDFEGLTYSEVVKEYKKTVNEEALRKVVFQAKELRGRIESYWRFLSRYTNVYFKDSEAALRWLNSIIGFLEE